MDGIGLLRGAMTLHNVDKTRVLLSKYDKLLQLFQASVPLWFVVINIPGELKTRRRIRFLLVIADRLSKLKRPIPMKTITSACVTHAFVTNLVVFYGPPT